MEENVTIIAKTSGQSHDPDIGEYLVTWKSKQSNVSAVALNAGRTIANHLIVQLHSAEMTLNCSKLGVSLRRYKYADP